MVAGSYNFWSLQLTKNDQSSFDELLEPAIQQILAIKATKLGG